MEESIRIALIFIGACTVIVVLFIAAWCFIDEVVFRIRAYKMRRFVLSKGWIPGPPPEDEE